MATLNIITQPNEILRKRSKEVTDFSSRLHELLDDMAETMRAREGLGIAAVQVGILWRACIVDSADGLVELDNPVIIPQSKPKKGDEGCLSVPGARGGVSRSQEITVRAQDRHGKPFERKFTGMEAVCVGHEIDHFDGILFTDRVGGEK